MHENHNACAKILVYNYRFSEKDLTGMNDGAMILTRPDQTRPDQPNYDLLYDKGYYGDSLHVNHLLEKKLTFRVIHDGYILPNTPDSNGGVFDADGACLTHGQYGTVDSLEKALNDPDSTSGISLTQLSDAHLIDISKATHHHSTVVYLGIMLKTWGHFLTDDMRHLWFLRSKEYRENFSDCQMVYLPAQAFEPKGNWLRMLEILGINTSLMTPVTELARYDRIIVPDECFFMTRDETRYFTREYVEIVDSIRDFAITHSHPVKSKKVYFSRFKLSDDKSIGEDKLEKYFASKGYEIVYPEKLSVDEQLNILVNCESFASTIGSCAHNMLFLRDNTEVIFIPRVNDFFHYQPALDQIHRQNIHYIDSSFSIFVHKDPWIGPFMFFISSNLRKYFHDEDTESIVYPSDFWKYVRLAFGLRTGRAFGMIFEINNPEVYRYYSAIAGDYFSKLIKMSWPYRLRQWLKRLLRRRR